MTDSEIRALLRPSIGWVYVLGAGAPSTPWPRPRVDCSGHAQMCAVEAGLMDASEPDRTADGLYRWCELVTRSELRPGFFVFYVGENDAPAEAGPDGRTPTRVRHVATVFDVKADGAIEVLCASSGLGRVHLARHGHRGGFVGFGRPPRR